MGLRLIVFAIIAAFAAAAWLASSAELERRHAPRAQAAMLRADYSQCMPVHNGPLGKARRPTSGRPPNSEIT